MTYLLLIIGSLLLGKCLAWDRPIMSWPVWLGFIGYALVLIALVLIDLKLTEGT